MFEKSILVKKTCTVYDKDTQNQQPVNGLLEFVLEILMSKVQSEVDQSRKKSIKISKKSTKIESIVGYTKKHNRVHHELSANILKIRVSVCIEPFMKRLISSGKNG